MTCPGFFKCKNSTICLEPSKVCDGRRDCIKGDDELLCSHICPDNCSCEGLSVNCHRHSIVDFNIFSNDIRKLDVSNSDFFSIFPNLSKFHLLAELNMSSCKISSLAPYDFQSLQNLYSLDMSSNKISQFVARTFEGLQNLKILLLNDNLDLQNIEEYAFSGLTRLTSLTIKNTKITRIFAHTFEGLQHATKLDLRNNRIKAIDNYAFHGLDNLLELNIRGNDVTYFSSDIFLGLNVLEKLQTDAYMFCCLKPETVSIENCYPPEDEFSSCADLMRNDILRWFLWIIGFSALLGNFGVLIYRFVFDRPTLKKGHGVIIANLGISDFCMGIYLIVIASADTHYRGIYIWNDISWREGQICSFAGVMSFIASECSVVFLCLITIDRIIAVRFPFGQYRVTQKRAIVACLSVWILMAAIAAAPLLPISYFSNEFYSRSAVCLALPLTRDKPAGWEYGTAIFVIFNFLVFLIIAAGQLVIYKEVAIAVDAKIRTQRRSQDMAVARGLFLVVLSDFVCWFPIGVMGKKYLFKKEKDEF